MQNNNRVALPVAREPQLLDALVERLDLLALDRMTIVDLLNYAPRREDAGLTVILALMFAALADGSLCLELLPTALEARLHRSGLPALDGLLGEFIAGLANDDYHDLIDRSGGDAFLPLIADTLNGRQLLYFQKFYFHERRLKRCLERFASLKAQNKTSPVAMTAIIDRLYSHAAVIRKGIGGAPIARDPFQEEAIRAALEAPLLVVSGGPGTGKTSLLVNILRALVRCGVDPNRILLAAPTGRAAQRMTEALTNSLATIADPQPDDLALSQLRGATLHKLLAYSHRSGGFLHDARTPIQADVIAVDEVSMVDVVMMDRFFQAVDPRRTRVILLGDKDQLPSVEAGAVLADMRPAAAGDHTNHYVELQNVYRSEGRLLELSRTINAGRWKAVQPLPFGDALGLPAGQWAFVAATDGSTLDADLNQWTVHQYDSPITEDGQSYIDLVNRLTLPRPASTPVAQPHAWLDQLFRLASRSRILTVVRQGRFGVGRINTLIAQTLRSRLDPAASGDGRLFNGALIMITRNDYQRQLFNGDVGVVLMRAEGGYTVYFKRPPGVVAFPAASLPEWELAFAMTVHKSQGSEFDDTWLILPEDPAHRLLTRELVYTATTRAAKRLILYGSVEVLKAALQRKIERVSGLTA
ncbi:exodeoxyribonuclease V subunit alpha [Desulfosarcina cetonica]|uniref:exodeoxyribonuclease V subunit alpha n=1 Tax=Desulfosarcina cetonica TaxID=90730 RepID=UPI00155DA7D0|nr:exodeoxyribonuclease V subunit alpha [Desulfosarcina cetonica]